MRLAPVLARRSSSSVGVRLPFRSCRWRFQPTRASSALPIIGQWTVPSDDARCERDANVRLGRVIGSVVSTRKHEKLEGAKLLLVQPLTAGDEPSGPPLLAIDAAQAGAGDKVLVVIEGRGRRLGAASPCGARRCSDRRRRRPGRALGPTGIPRLAFPPSEGSAWWLTVTCGPRSIRPSGVISNAGRHLHRPSFLGTPCATRACPVRAPARR